jgi:hypothetical protein
MRLYKKQDLTQIALRDPQFMHVRDGLNEPFSGNSLLIYKTNIRSDVTDWWHLFLNACAICFAFDRISLRGNIYSVPWKGGLEEVSK